jgi:chromosome segregation ATPase
MMLEQLEKFKTEIFVLLSTLLGYLLGKRKTNAEIANTDADSNKTKAEEEQIRAQTMLELQKGMLEINSKLETMYESREAQRNANRIEQERLSKNQSDLAARNYELADTLQKQSQANFERELSYTNRIAELERKLEGQQARVEVIEKKTGSLENKMPSHG